MEQFNQFIFEYKKQLEKGDIKKAYKGIMDFMQNLRTQFDRQYPGYSVSGNIYFGYMDMTYFAFTPSLLKEKKLKIALVFIHDNISFEVWLSGYNKAVQEKLIKQLKGKTLNNYEIAPTTQGYDYILKHVLTENPDFGNPDSLTVMLEKETLKFIENVEGYLSDK